jgi:preprotein translocase subunit SecF
VIPKIGETAMKTFAAIAVAGLIAGAGVMWFFSNPVVVTATVQPLKPSDKIPTFKRVEEPMPRH